MKTSILSVAVALVQLAIVQSCCTDPGLSCCPKMIPGTQLKSRTFYKLGLKKFPSGTVTWTAQSNSTYNFVQIDNDPDHYLKYLPLGEWHYDAMWEFIPILSYNRETGWYGLRNRGRPSAYLAYETSESSNGSPRSHHVVLERNWASEDIGEYLLKPISVDCGGETYYQIQFKNLPDGSVTWTGKKYGEGGSHYIQVDDQPDVADKYREGGEWHEDTLFTVYPAETPVDVDSIEK